MIISILFLLINLASSDSILIKDNNHVELKIEIDSSKINSENIISLKVKFFPTNGIKINSDPQIEFILDKKNNFVLISQTNPSSDSSGYLLNDSEVIFNFKTKSKSKDIFIAGKLNYFYCSSSEGWCNRYSQKIKIPIKTIK